METLTRLARQAAPHLLSLLRVMAALLLLQHGMQKLLGFPPMPAGRSGPEFLSLIWFAGIIELIGGILLAIGLFSRATAFILSGQLAFAYWIGHAPRGFLPILNAGELAALYSFVFLYLSAAGPGPWSIDHLLTGGHRAPDRVE